eukprot:scaffold69309_cov65-Phaeocystis_antarctica.AAC.17
MSHGRGGRPRSRGRLPARLSARPARGCAARRAGAFGGHGRRAVDPLLLGGGRTRHLHRRGGRATSPYGGRAAANRRRACLHLPEVGLEAALLLGPPAALPAANVLEQQRRVIPREGDGGGRSGHGRLRTVCLRLHLRLRLRLRLRLCLRLRLRLRSLPRLAFGRGLGHCLEQLPRAVPLEHLSRRWDADRGRRLPLKAG